MICEKCGNVMVKGNKYWFCEECSNKVQIKLSQDIRFAKEDDIQCPEIIAHEYNRLKNLLYGCNYYGALLQTKDTYEIILKIPILIFLNGCIEEVKSNNNNNKQSRQIIELMSNKMLSLGDWEVVALKIAKMNMNSISDSENGLYRFTASYIKEIINKYKTREGKMISYWRNESIGHGALGFCSDETFLEELEYLVNQLANIMLLSQRFYDSIKFQLSNYKSSLNLHENKNNIYINYNSERISVHPLISYLLGLVYIYDSFNPYKNIAYKLNYSHGKKVECDETRQLLLQIKREFKLNEISEISVSEKTIEKELLSKVNLTLSDKLILKPNHFDDYILSIVGYREKYKAYDKGVFMIRAEKSMGKSIFARGVDELDDLSILKKSKEYNNIIVRTIQLNNSYYSRSDLLKSRIVDVLSSIRNQEKNIIESNIYYGKFHAELADLLNQSDRTKQEKQKLLADLLNKAYKLLIKTYKNKGYASKEKLLLIIDGLDEVNPINYRGIVADSIFDYIPKSEMLDNGIYILLMSRKAEELKENTVIYEQIESINVLDKVEFDRENAEYRSLLKHYIRNTIDDIDDVQIDLILKNFNYYFAYISAYVRLRKGQSLDDKLIEYEDLLGTYLENLNKSNKGYYGKILQILINLVVIKEPALIEELLYLIDEPQVNFKFLATINDLKDFIDYKRTCLGSVLSINHYIWRSSVERHLSNEIEEVINKYSTKVDEFIRKINNNEINLKVERKNYCGEIYLLVQFWGIVNDYNMINKIDDECIIKRIKNFKRAYENIKNIGIDKKHLNQMIVLLKNCINIVNLLEDKGYEGQYLLSELYADLGDENYKAFNLYLAIEAFDKAINVIEKLNFENISHKYSDLARVYINKAATLCGLNKFAEAILQYNKAIELNEKLILECRLIDQNCLARVYVGKGDALNGLSQFEKAIEEYDKAIEIGGFLRKKDIKAVDYRWLSSSYVNKGIALKNLNKFEKAIEEYNKAIIIMERLKLKNKLDDLNDLASAYTNKGVALRNINQPYRAIEEYNKVIEIRENLKLKNELHNTNYLAKVYMNKGVALSELNQLEESIIAYDKAIEIMERLRKENKLQNPNYLARVYLNKSNVLDKMYKFKESQEEVVKSNELLNQLKSQNELYDYNDLVRGYIHSGKMFSRLNNFKESMDEYNNAIEILEKQNAENKLYNQNELALAYMNKGILLNKFNKFEDSIEEFEKALNIIDTLKVEERLYDYIDLATIYINKGVSLKGLMQYKESIVENNKAIEILEMLRVENKIYDLTVLAKSYLNKALALIGLNKFQKAMEENEKAIEILEMLKSENKLYNYEYLYEVYISKTLALVGLGQLEKSLKENDKAIDILSKLGKKLSKHSELDLANVVNYKGLTLARLDQFEKAIEEYNKAIKIMEELRLENRLGNLNELVKIYMNKGSSLEKLNQFGKAIDEYDKSIKIMEHLKIESKLNKITHLTNAYRSKAFALDKLNQFRNAVDEYNKIIKLIETSKSVDESQYTDVLSDAYMNRSIAFMDLKNIPLALEDALTTMDIYEKNVKEQWVSHDDFTKSIHMVMHFSEQLGCLCEYLEKIRSSFKLLKTDNLSEKAHEWLNEIKIIVTDEKKILDSIIYKLNELIGEIEVKNEKDEKIKYTMTALIYINEHSFYGIYCSEIYENFNIYKINILVDTIKFEAVQDYDEFNEVMRLYQKNASNFEIGK